MADRIAADRCRSYPRFERAVDRAIGFGAARRAVGIRQPQRTGEPDPGLRRNAPVPCTVSLIRRGGTSIAFANQYWEMPIGFRRSSTSTSPGAIGG
jgi:hypothetical protein